jgi:hypothetical protein
MVERLLELTRVDDRADGSPVLVNLDNVAWIERADDTASRIVFAVGLHHERANGPPLAILVRETIEDIALLASVIRKTDREAIAQAWADQSSRRRPDLADE